MVDTGAGAQTRPRGRVDVGAVGLVGGIETMIGAFHHRAEIRRRRRGEILGVTVETGGRRHAQGVPREGGDGMIDVLCVGSF